MQKSILLTYLISSNARWEIIDFIADEMVQQGAKVDVIPAGKVSSLEEYEMVVLGAPVYTFMWPKKLHRFLSKHSETLKTLPTAVFVVGTDLDKKEMEGEQAHKHINKTLNKFDWLKPTSLELFSITAFFRRQRKSKNTLILKNLPKTNAHRTGHRLGCNPEMGKGSAGIITKTRPCMHLHF